MDAADINNITTITGETTASIVTTLNVNDTDDIGTGATVTNIDVVTIGTAANTNQTLSVASADLTATNFTTITGSGDDNLTSVIAGAITLVNTTVSGIDVIDITASGANDLTLDAASISGSVTLTANAGADLLITEGGTYTNLTTTAADFDSMVLSGAATVQTYNVSESIFDGSGTTSIVAIDGTGAATDPALAIGMVGTSFDLTGVTTGAIQDVDITITGTSGSDTITVADASTAGSAMNVVTGTGSDTVQVRGASGNAVVGDTQKTLVIADAVRITDFDAGNDIFSLDISDGNGINNTVGTSAGGAAAFTTGAGFQLISGAAVNDFSSSTAVISALGNHTTGDDDIFFFALQNVSGSQVGVYAAQSKGAAIAAVLDANDGITLVSVIDVTAGTFSTANMLVY
jgi:hypothetical protein